MALFGNADESIQVKISSSANTKGFKDASKAAKETETGFDKLNARSVALGVVMANTLTRAGNFLADGFRASTGAAFGQVKAVEEASFALKAYEKDGKKVDKVLTDLVKFARSDTGVLFQRQDLFDAASTLKLYGEETSNLTERVKILSKGVAGGKTTFQELSQIIGRAAAKGRLDAVDFDMLIERGIGLNRSFRGTKVSAEELYDELNRALPDELLKGRADTIEGRTIRLQSAFRDLGLQVLGVDKETSKFIEGGLGDRFVKGLTSATELMRDLAPAVGEASQFVVSLLDGAGKLAVQLGNTLQPHLGALFNSFRDDLIPVVAEFWGEYIEPLIPILGVALVEALRLSIDILNDLVVAFSEVLNFINNNEMIFLPLITTIGLLWAAMKVKAGFVALQAGFNVITASTIPQAMAKFTAFKTLVMSPIVMPAIVIGAALMALNHLINKWHETLDEVNGQQSSHGAGTTSFFESLKRARDEGRISQSEYTRRLKGYNQNFESFTDAPFLARGGTAMSNKPHIVGEDGPELFIPNSTGRVYSNKDSQGMLGGGSIVYKTEISGDIYLQDASAVDQFFRRLDIDNNLSEKGLTPMGSM